MAGSSTPLRGWIDDHYLHLGQLPPGTRRLTLLCVAVGGAAALTMIVAALTEVRLYSVVCPRPAESATALVGSAIALSSIALGLAVLAMAGRYAGSSFPRTRFLLLLVVPLLLLLSLLVATGSLGGQGAAVVLSPLRVVMLFVTLELVLVVVAITSARGPVSAGATTAVVVTGLVGFAGYVAVTVPVVGTCEGGRLVGGAFAMLSALSLAAVPVLLIWLAAEGLRLSGDLARWALVRVPERRLLTGLLSLKLLLLALAVGLLLAGRAPRWLAGLVPSSAAAWLVAVVLVALIAALLSFETRLVSASGSDFGVISRGFALLAGAALVAVPLLILVVLLSILTDRPRVLLALPVCVLAGIATGLLNRRPRPALVAVGAALLAGSFGLLLWALLTSPLGSTMDVSSILNVTALGWLLGGFLAVGLLVLVGFLIARPALRRSLIFLVALVLWVAVTLLLPYLGVTAVGVDVILTLVIALLAVAARLGWQRAISAYELVLLLVTSSVIIEAPLLIGVLPTSTHVPLLIAAFLAPAVAAVTLEAQPLNAEPHHRPVRLYLTLGVLCVGYGLLSTLALLVDESLDVVQNLAQLFNGMAALPFAVVLVAVLSASRQRADAVGPDS